MCTFILTHADLAIPITDQHVPCTNNPKRHSNQALEKSPAQMRGGDAPPPRKEEGTSTPLQLWGEPNTMLETNTETQ